MIAEVNNFKYLLFIKYSNLSEQHTKEEWFVAVLNQIKKP